MTEFRDSRETRHLPEGDIWFRESDLMPLRITHWLATVLQQAGWSRVGWRDLTGGIVALHRAVNA